ncbi:MAG: AraC family transcriptional regulator [Alphaproteobacteria bacterium]|nr:MAG: AraC family transcriptional regulator [Alphaproteobacteria bacterium]
MQQDPDRGPIRSRNRSLPQQTFLGTSISGWGRSVLLALDRLGFDGKAIFKECGLNPDDQGNALVRNPVAKMQHVWRVAESVASDKNLLAVEIARHLNASSFYALGFGLYASSSIDDMFQRFARYAGILSASVNFLIKKTDLDVMFEIDDRRVVRSHLTSVVFLLFLLRICRELGGTDVMPRRIEVSWDEDDYTPALRTVTDAPIFRQRPRSFLQFNREPVERRLPSANAELASFQDRLCRDYLASLDEHAHLPSRVRLKIVQGLANETLTMKRVASSLNMSQRSLQRKLQEEGTSYRAILNEARRELAASYAMNEELSATEISYLLGFSNPAQFATTFRNWHGKTFTEYRKTTVR